MSEVKYGHKFHPHHPMIDGRDVVLAEDFDAAQSREAELRDALHESEERSDSRSRQSSAFEMRMGDLQVENGKLKDCLSAADERVDLLMAENTALRKDAERYRWLRGRDLESIHAGGVFAGQTPRNVVMNGEDLDNAIDTALKSAKGGFYDA